MTGVWSSGTQIMTHIGQVIHYHRKRLGMTQLALAERIGCSERTLRSWEKGQSSPSWFNVESLFEDVFEMSMLVAYQGLEMDER